MNLKDKNDLMALLNKTKDIYQNVSRAIHWSAADSEMLDSLMDSKEWEKTVGRRIQSVDKSLFAIEILPSFLIYKTWQRTKAVYSFRPELVDDLSYTEDTSLHTTLLERLPFKDMLLFFPEGALPKHENEDQEVACSNHVTPTKKKLEITTISGFFFLPKIREI